LGGSRIANKWMRVTVRMVMVSRMVGRFRDS